MQIQSFKVFCDVADARSFTKAAQLNSVTQSAVSQTLTSLENHFKSLLVERSKKNFRLTAEGEVVYDYGKRLLQSYEAIQHTMQELKDIISGDIRVATVYSIGLHDLPPYLKKFLQTYPTVNVHVEYRRANQVYEDIIGNVVDLGLVAYPHPHPKVQIVPLRRDPLVLICHPDHPFAKRTMVKLKMLEGQKFISFEPDMPTRKALDKILRAKGVKVQHAMEFDNIETVKQAVSLDSGVAIVPAETIKLEVANRFVAAVKLEGRYYRQLGAIYRKNKVLSPAMKQFLVLLKETM
ncbi:Transcriptional regulator, LysR family [Verrucomicrobia bacterium]|nr:Transcriptional regulator, LysR family [Verrucomicrobiota bacterium]